MSETLHHSEKPKQHEVPAHSPENSPVHTPETSKKPSHKIEAEAREMKAEAREVVDHNANRAEQLTERIEAATKPSHTPHRQDVNQELQNVTKDRWIHRLQQKESAPQRVLSKLIHQPVVRAVSEAAGKTVSRPSGLLGGSLVAFLGTSSYLYFAKHLGFTYNYLIFLELFCAGFIIGIGLELAVHAITRSRRSSEG